MRKQPLFSEIKEIDIPYDPSALQGQMGDIPESVVQHTKNASFTVDIIIKHVYDKK
ncbi:MAG: hypothetical protein R3E08_04395 [Thiotrichaceae bacterium]